MMGWAWLLLALCAAIVFDAGVDSSNPDVKLRVTRRRHGYANQQAVSALSKAFRRISFPSFTIKLTNKVNLNVRNLRVTRFDHPRSRISHLRGGGFRWSLRNVGLALRANFRVFGRWGWIPFSVSGIATADASRLSMTVDLRKGRVAWCHASLGSLDVKVKTTGFLNGAVSSIINDHLHGITKKFRKTLQDKICPTVERIANSIHPLLSGRAAEGMPLPLTSDIHHINNRLAPKEKDVVIATDLNDRP